jgi:hypothetical protein
LWKNDGLEGFLRSINDIGEAFLFGGAPRDVAFGAAKNVNDLDIFVSGPISFDKLSGVATIVKRTNFGGYRLIAGKFEIDVWELEKSYAFRYDAASYINTRNLLSSVCFSTDGIAVSLKSGKTSSTNEFISSLLDKRLDFVVPPVKLEPVIGARIARLSLKLQLELTPSVASYFVQCVDEFGVSAMIDAESRWGDKRMLHDIAIEQVRFDIQEAILRAYGQLRS